MLRALRSDRASDAAACGAAFGLSYLTRWQGAAFPAIAFVALALPSLRAATVSLLVMLPYLVNVYRVSGHLRIEGESVVNAVLADGMMRGRSDTFGMVAAAAARRSGADCDRRRSLCRPQLSLALLASLRRGLRPVPRALGGQGRRRARRVEPRLGIPNLGALALAAFAAIALAVDWQEARDGLAAPERAAGAWIARHAADPFIVDISDRVAYYAGVRARWQPLPYASPAIACRYLARVRADFVVIDTARADDYPPLASWFVNGPSCPNTALAYRVDRLRIYRRTGRSGPGNYGTSARWNNS